MWSIIVWVVIGGLAGWAASKVSKSDKDRGVLGNILLGIVGAFVAGLAIQLLGGEGFTGFNLWSFFVAFIGALIVLAIKRSLEGRKG